MEGIIFSLDDSSFPKSFNLKKLRPWSFLLHLMILTWASSRITSTSETLDPKIPPFWSWCCGFAHHISTNLVCSYAAERGFYAIKSHQLSESHVLSCSETCLLTPAVYAAQWCQWVFCMSKQVILSSKIVIWLFYIDCLNFEGVLHKLLPKKHF